jgi:hypothetical protein
MVGELGKPDYIGFGNDPARAKLRQFLRRPPVSVQTVSDPAKAAQ